ncbi:MAG: anti-sigma factor [Nitrospiraceae bacterium]|nr:anti-sigma factor [Nitrospiraceae bacterium]
MMHEELEDAVPLYAVGALERVERQALEAHLLSGCVSCHTALKDYQSVAAVLPFGLNPAAPPRGLKTKLMTALSPPAVTSEIGPRSSPKPSLEPGEWMNHLFPPETPSRATRLGWALAFATVVLIGIGGYLAWDAYTRITDSSTRLTQLQADAEATRSQLAMVQQHVTEREKALVQLQEELQQRMTEAAELKDQLDEREAELEEVKTLIAQRGGKLRTPQDELATLLRIPDVKAVSLTGSDMAKDAAGFLLFDERARKAWLYSVNLPECPQGMTYQVWAIQDKPVSLGTFHMNSGETAHLLVKHIPGVMEAKQFAVSLEPLGGRPRPTGTIYLASSASH